MPGSTEFGYPYPLGTDAISQGDDTIKALAEAIDARLGKCLSGVVGITAPGNGSASMAVTFPVGYFTVAPEVIALPVTTGPGVAYACAYSVTVSAFTGWAYRVGTSSTVQVGWQAIQQA